jgi:hypothetical protein
VLPAAREALIEMDLAGVSVRRVEDITEALWGTMVGLVACRSGGTGAYCVEYGECKVNLNQILTTATAD